MDEDLDEFLNKVEEIGYIIKSLGSEDKTEVENACQKADKLLMNADSKNLGRHSFVDEDGIYVKTNITLINKSSSLGNNTSEVCAAHGSNKMSKEAFLAYVSKDASRRCADKKRHKAKSDALKKEGNLAFRSGDYTKALNFYTKAIEEVRDSCVLYTNRALTFLQLEHHGKALEDCKLALRLSPTSLKALVYKAKAHRSLGEIDLADSCVQEALNYHPQHTDCIKYAVEKHTLHKAT